MDKSEKARMAREQVLGMQKEPWKTAILHAAKTLPVVECAAETWQRGKIETVVIGNLN